MPPTVEEKITSKQPNPFKNTIGTSASDDVYRSMIGTLNQSSKSKRLGTLYDLDSFSYSYIKCT